MHYPVYVLRRMIQTESSFTQTLDIFFNSKDLLIIHTKYVLSPVIQMLK